MARPKRIEGAPDTSEQILQAARFEFAAHGQSARLEDIAARCGIRRASLLHHFASKQLLMDALFERAFELTLQRVTMAAANTQGNYAATIRGVTGVLRLIEEEDEGTAAIVLHALMTEDSHEGLRNLAERLLDQVTVLAQQAGAVAHHPLATIRAVIAHIVMGELSRLALGAQATRYWGDSDAVWPLVDLFFKLTPVETTP